VHGRNLLSQGTGRGLRAGWHLRILLLRSAADHHRRHRQPDQSASNQVATMNGERSCELCEPAMVLLQDELAYVRYDNNGLSPGHVMAVPRRHVANFFDM